MLANVGYLYLLSKGVDSVSREQINDWDMIAKVQEAKAAIPTVVARAWTDLHQRGCLPSWAVRQVKAEMMELAAL